MGEDMTELAAEEMRTGIRALDALVGRIDVENLLDEIFASFCLGK
jgi:tRNA modification GTPase